MRPLVFRPSSGIVVTVVVWLITAVVLLNLVLVGDGSGSEVRPLGAVLVAASWFTWVALWWPAVIVSAAGVVVRNPLRTTRIAWGELTDLDDRRSLVLSTSAGPVNAWAAPPPTPMQARRDARLARRRSAGASDAEARDTQPRAGDAIRRFRDGRYRLPAGDEAIVGVTTTWNVPVVATSIAIVAAAALALVLV